MSDATLNKFIDHYIPQSKTQHHTNITNSFIHHGLHSVYLSIIGFLKITTPLQGHLTHSLVWYFRTETSQSGRVLQRPSVVGGWPTVGWGQKVGEESSSAHPSLPFWHSTSLHGGQKPQHRHTHRKLHIYSICFDLYTFVITSDPLSLLPLSAVSALPNAMIFSCLVLGPPWPTLAPLLLLVCHSGITSLLMFARLFSLLPFPRLSLSRLKSRLFPGIEMRWKRFCLAYTLRSAI